MMYQQIKDLIDSGLFSCSESFCLIVNQSHPNLFLHRTLCYRSDVCRISSSLYKRFRLAKSFVFLFNLRLQYRLFFIQHTQKSFFLFFGVCRSRTCSEILSATSLANCSITALATHLLFPSLELSNSSVFNLDLLFDIFTKIIFNIFA